jgi:hypothetical protein
MPRVLKSGLILPAAAVAGVLAAACSFDAGKLRARQVVDSAAREADAMEADTSFDHPQDKNLGVHDSFVEVVADRAHSMSDLGAAAETEGTLEDAGDASADLPMGTGGSIDARETGGTGGAGGMPASDGEAATGGIGGSLDAGGAGGTVAGDTGGTTGLAGATATGGAGGSLDTGGAGGTVGGDTGSATGLAGATATGGTGGSLATGGVGGTAGMPASAGATARGGTGGSVSLPAGLVGWWKMDEAAGSSTAVDASGNGNDATLTGLNPASAWATGRTGGALKCDGSGAALVNDSARLDGITAGVTISAWVNRLGAATGFTAVLSREIGTTITEYYYLGLSGDRAEFYSSSGGLSTTTIPIGIWTHMAATDDGNTVRLYVNGSQVASKNVSDVFKADSSKLTICGNQNDASGAITQRWNGLVDDLQLYNRALTATEIAGLAK